MQSDAGSDANEDSLSLMMVSVSNATLVICQLWRLAAELEPSYEHMEQWAEAQLCIYLSELEYSTFDKTMEATHFTIFSNFQFQSTWWPLFIIGVPCFPACSKPTALDLYWSYVFSNLPICWNIENNSFSLVFQFVQVQLTWKPLCFFGFAALPGSTSMKTIVFLWFFW